MVEGLIKNRNELKWKIVDENGKVFNKYRTKALAGKTCYELNFENNGFGKKYHLERI